MLKKIFGNTNYTDVYSLKTKKKCKVLYFVFPYQNIKKARHYFLVNSEWRTVKNLLKNYSKYIYKKLFVLFQTF